MVAVASSARLGGSLPGFGVAPGHSWRPDSIVSSSTAMPGAHAAHHTRVTPCAGEAPVSRAIAPARHASNRSRTGPKGTGAVGRERA